MTLRQLGERFLLQNVIPDYCKTAGDDCGRLRLNGLELLVTTDPVPTPAAQVIGHDPDPYWMGWLLVIINVSDLAAAGAEPIGFVSAIDAEPSRDIEGFRRLLTGIRDACEAERIPYVGGNLREAVGLGGVGTAIGLCKPGLALNRAGAQPGNLLVSVGAGGIFWRDVFRLRLNGVFPESKMHSPLFAPRTQVQVMQKLAELRKLHAAIDNSDGLIPSVQQLLYASGVSGTIELSALLVPGLGDLDVDQARLWLGWGDWNVVAAISQNDLHEVVEIAASMGAALTVIGHVEPGQCELFVRRSGEKIFAPRLESERFAEDSWFAEGIDGYINRLLTVHLPS